MNHDDYPLPHWATGKTTDPMEIGAQLRTKDGRKCGNATTIGRAEKFGLALAIVVTDAGSTMMLTREELNVLFHEPEYLMDPSTCPGLRDLAAVSDDTLLTIGNLHYTCSTREGFLIKARKALNGSQKPGAGETAGVRP
ncbi:MAG: hypothetical protein AB1642_13330 [Pseudomonadota bacterium]